MLGEAPLPVEPSAPAQETTSDIVLTGTIWRMIPLALAVQLRPESVGQSPPGRHLVAAILELQVWEVACRPFPGMAIRMVPQLGPSPETRVRDGCRYNCGCPA